MRVAVICGAGMFSGKETMALELAEGFRRQGGSVEIVTSLWGNGVFANRLTELGFPVHRMRLGFISASLTFDCLRMTADQLWRWPGLLIDYRRFLRQGRPRFIIHTNWHHLLMLWPFLEPERDLFWLHESIPDKPQYRRVFGRLARRLGCFIPVSHAVAESLRRIGIPGHKIRVIHNGLGDPVSAERVRQPKGNGLRIGIVGQVEAWKGHENLLAAFALISERHPSAELHIFGSDEREFADKLKAQSKTLGFASRVVWHGFVNDRQTIYSGMDICVVPSRADDPLPTVAIEAAFFGLPVVATRRGGLPEIIEDGVTGFLVQAENPPLLAVRLDELLQNAEFRNRMGQAARRRAETCFSRERFMGDFLRLLNDSPQE